MVVRGRPMLLTFTAAVFVLHAEVVSPKERGGGLLKVMAMLHVVTRVPGGSLVGVMVVWMVVMVGLVVLRLLS